MAENTTSNITTDLFDAIYTIVSGVVSRQNYDITKECRVIEAYTNDAGERTNVYKVKSQDAIFDAYARQGDVYSVDQWVYVLIPNGDFKQQKFITGIKVNSDDTNDIYSLKLPFDNFVGFYNLSLNTPMSEVGYWANCPFHGDSTIQVAEPKSDGVIFPLNEDHMWHWENREKKAIAATKLGLSLDVTTLLHAFNPSQGTYGVRIVVKGMTSTGEESTATEPLVREYYFTNQQMYGNPYAYSTGSTQEIVVDISEFNKEIGSIDLWFYQDHEHPFKDDHGNAIPWGSSTDTSKEFAEKVKSLEENESLTEETRKSLIQKLYNDYAQESTRSAELKNIIFNNLVCLLGFNAEELENETLTIYTYDVTQYGVTDTASEAVRKPNRILRGFWIHNIDKNIQLIDSYEQLAELDANIYWYYYDPLWTSENEEYNEEEVAHRLGGNYWHPLNGGTETWAADADLSFMVTPRLDVAKERYKAVIHYNKNVITSNTFVFYNSNSTVESDRANLARNDTMILRCATVQDGILKPDSTLGNFFVYNENNNVLANDNNVLFSDVQYFIEPWINPSFVQGISDTQIEENEYVRLSEYTDADGRPLNYSITWQFPEGFTMIKSWGLLDDSARDILYWNMRSDMQFQKDIMSTRYFYIDAIYNTRYGDNEISATIDIEGHGSFNIKKTLQFGQADAFGCEFTPVISIVKPAGNFYIDTNVDFELNCLVYDRSGQLMPESDRKNCRFTWKFYGTSAKPKDKNQHENAEGFIGNVVRDRILRPEPFIAEVTVSNAAAYDITVRRGFLVSNNAEFMQSHDITCPNRIEFKSDGQAPIYDSNAFVVSEITNDVNNLIYPTWRINNTRILDLVFQKIEFPTLVDVNGERYEYDQEELLSYGLSFVKQHLNTNIAQSSIYGQQWTEDLLDEDYFTYIYFTYEGATVAQAIAFAQNAYSSSLVNEWNGQSLSLDEENGAVLAKMIAAGTKDQKNRFTGVMLGDWHEKGDSSLDVAGLYGFSTGTQSFGLKTDGTGFIGPAGAGRIQFDGKNALISNSTQTCYINLNPRRVLDDYFGIDGEVDPAAWHGLGNQSISQYFLYAQTPRRVSTFCTNSDTEIQGGDWSIHTEHYWAKQFFEDEDHDYFAVDPNYGVMTSGGIFARYGRLGKDYPWVISDYGLTQKNNFGRIFLGNPEKNLSQASLIPNPTYTLGDTEVSVYTPTGSEEEIAIPNNFFTASFANEKNIIQTGIRSDGYFYTKYATIGGWHLNDKEIYATLSGFDVSDSFRKTYEADGYKKDAINLNASGQFISFNQGRFVINGQFGWMGFYNNQNGDTIELLATPSAYDMWIDFQNGSVNFGKKPPYQDLDTEEIIDPVPYVKIDGKSGKAYFAGGKIFIDGETATIFCGTQQESGVYYTGTLQLADVKINVLTTEITDYPSGGVGILNDSPSGSRLPSVLQREFSTTNDQEDLYSFSQYWGGTNTKTAEYRLTSSLSYVEGRTYYILKNGNYVVYTPSFAYTITVSTNAATFVTVEDQSKFIEKVGISLTSVQTRGYTFTREKGTDVTQPDENAPATIDDTPTYLFGDWYYNQEKINLVDYGLKIISNSTDVVSFQVTVTVTISNWDPSNIYDYVVDSEDLTPLNLPVRLSVPDENKLTSRVVSLDPQNLSAKLSITQNGEGMTLYIGVEEIGEEGQTQKYSTAVLSPTAVHNGILSNWHIDAKTIVVQDSMKVMTTLTAGAMIVIENGSENPVASQLWVENYIVNEVWKKIEDVNNAASSAMSRAETAINIATKAANTANANTVKIQELLDISVKGVLVASAELGAGQTVLQAQTYLHNGSMVYQTVMPKVASINHNHAIQLSWSDGKLSYIPVTSNTTFTSASSTDVADLSGAVYNLESDSENGTLSWKTYGGTPGNFNIAGTEYFKTRAVSAVKMEASTAGVGTGAYAYAYDMNDEKISGKYATCALSLNSTDKKVNLYYSGSVVASCDLSSFHTAAYNAGWNACREAMGSGTTFTYQRTGRLYSKSTAADGTESYTDRGNRYWYSASDSDLGGTYYKKPDAK